MTLVDQASYVLTGAGVVVGVLGALLTRSRSVLPAVLELWTAAGLLRLTTDRAWSAVATAAALVVIRHVVARTMLSPVRAATSR